MGLACKISGHKWNGCTCSRCGEYRDKEHKWVFAAQESKKAQQCREKCSVCGKQRDIEHAWDGCKCSGCGRVRNEGHVFGSFEQSPDGWGSGRGMYYHIGTCKRCGNTYSFEHRLERMPGCRGRCVDCGSELEYHDFKDGACRECGQDEEQYYFDFIYCSKRKFSEYICCTADSPGDTYGKHINSLGALLKLACLECCRYESVPIARQLRHLVGQGARPTPDEERALHFIATDEHEHMDLREAACAALVDEDLKAEAKERIAKSNAQIAYENAMIASDSGLYTTG